MKKKTYSLSWLIIPVTILGLGACLLWLLLFAINKIYHFF